MSANGAAVTDPGLVAWNMLGAGSHAVWWSVVGTVIQGMLVSTIVSKTIEYYEYFNESDNKYVKWAVGLGTTMAVATLGLTCAQVYELNYGATKDPGTAIRYVMLADMIVLFFGALFNVTAGGYYAFRAYKMSKSNLWIMPPFAAGLITVLVTAMLAVSWGLQFPVLTVEALPTLKPFMTKALRLYQIWGITALVVDMSLCLFMTCMLFRSREGIFQHEKRLFRRIVSLVYETMLPPVLALFILECAHHIKGSPLTDWRRIITCTLPVLYYHSALHTLAGRQAIRGILDSNLAAEGVHVLSDERNGTGSGSGNHHRPRVYSSFPKGKGSGGRGEREPEGGFRLIGLGKKSGSPEPPRIRVETSTLTSVSEPDTLVSQKRSVNRDWDKETMDPSELAEPSTAGLSLTDDDVSVKDERLWSTSFSGDRSPRR